LKIYFAAPWSYGPELLPLKDMVQEQGHIITSSWLNIENSTVSKNAHEAADYALQDLRDVDACDMLTLFNPSDHKQSPGRNIEFGYALARGKALAIVGERLGVFQYLPHIRYYTSNQHFLNGLIDKKHTAYP
jgi:nucleoside 2-deoxyribosyltransferase